MASPWNIALDHFYDATLIPSYCAPGYKLRRRTWKDPEIRVDLSGKVCIVTGANSGIGRATAEALAKRGAHVVMVCRNAERGRQALTEIQSTLEHPGRITLELCDLSERVQVADLAERLLASHETLDVLVNNAGVLLPERQQTSDGLELGFATNVLSGFQLTWRLRQRLSESKYGRIIHVTSGGMYTQRLRVNDLQFEGRPFDGVVAYAQNKRAQVILNEMWVQHLAPNVTTNCMHPGWAATPGVSTSLPRFNRMLSGLLRDCQQGADTTVYLAASPEVQDITGALFFDRKVRPTHVLPTTRSSQVERQELWQQCCELAKV